MRKLTKVKKTGFIALVLAGMMILFGACGDSGEGEGVSSLGSTEQISAFIEEIYEKVGQDNLPMMLEQRELDLNDADALSYNTGLDGKDGLTRVVISESMTGSIAYSLIYLCVDEGKDVQQMQQELMQSVNPAKWICVTAQKQASMTLGQDILFVMGEEQTVDLVVEAAKTLAEGRFSSIGSVKEN